MYNMNGTVRDYITFEEIKKVIDIDGDLKDDGGKSLVEQYVISNGIREHLKDLAINVSKSKHDSLQVIGSYGSGKSHMLAFIISILENKDNAKLIKDEEIRTLFVNKLNRNFKVVQFELHSNIKDMGEIFFFRIRQQLKKKYGIDIPKKDYNEIIDHKEEIDEILSIIKKDNPDSGLVVVIDEISDFMKGKPSKEAKIRDTQFMRVIAQKSKDCDFMFIGAMQEQIFTNPEFIDDADSLGRVYERFNVVQISREDIKKVVSNRMLKKNSEQKIELEKLLEGYAKKIPLVRNKMDEFIELYPIHPYVMDIFNELPIFETRGVISFTSNNVSQILDKDEGTFITFDKIYDQIADTHTLKNLDEIRPIIDAVSSLDSKIDLLRSHHQDYAKQIVKALAILKLHGKTLNNGATAEELANNLMVISDKFDSIDQIKIVLDNLRKVTEGQFISENKGYYFLDLENKIDYDVVINRKAENLTRSQKDEELLKIFIDNFQLGSKGEYDYRVFEDVCRWNDKNSFREGIFLYDDGESSLSTESQDFNFILKSPYIRESQWQGSGNNVILNINYNEQLDEFLKRIAATEILLGDNKYDKQIIKRKQTIAIKDLKKYLMEILMDSEVAYNNKIKKVKDLITKEPEILADLYVSLKQNVFQDYFNEKYNKYPRFTHGISKENIGNEVDKTIKTIVKVGIDGLDSNGKGYLKSLNLININGDVTIDKSEFSDIILAILKENPGKNVNLEEVRKRFKKEPYGVNEEILDLILIFLTYNGFINLVKRGGGDISSAELSEFFGKEGHNAFEKLVYMKLESDLPIMEIGETLKCFGINPSLLKDKNNRGKAVQLFKESILKMEQKQQEVLKGLKRLDGKLEIFNNTSKIYSYILEIDKLILENYKNINTPMSLKKLVITKDELEKLKHRLELIEKVFLFLKDYDEWIEKEYRYIKKSFLQDLKEVHTELRDSFKECSAIVKNIEKVINPEERRQLKGKIQQYKEKYKKIYWHLHEKNVGEEIKWDILDRIKNSKTFKNFHKLRLVTGISENKFCEVEKNITKLESLKCNNLNFDDLENYYNCPHCNYPERYNLDFDINQEIENIEKEINVLYTNWKKIILNQVDDYKNQIEFLNDNEKVIINNISSKRDLPKNIDESVIKAFNNLFKDIEERFISIEDIQRIIFCDGETLTIKDFEEKLDNLKRYVTTNIKNKENLRIKKK